MFGTFNVGWYLGYNGCIPTYRSSSPVNAHKNHHTYGQRPVLFHDNPRFVSLNLNMWSCGGKIQLVRPQLHPTISGCAKSGEVRRIFQFIFGTLQLAHGSVQK